MREELRQVLHKQGYGTVAEHVGVKLCHLVGALLNLAAWERDANA